MIWPITRGEVYLGETGKSMRAWSCWNLDRIVGVASRCQSLTRGRECNRLLSTVNSQRGLKTHLPIKPSRRRGSSLSLQAVSLCADFNVNFGCRENVARVMEIGMSRLWRICLTLLFIFPLSAAQETHSHSAPEKLGKVSFPISCTPTVQE